MKRLIVSNAQLGVMMIFGWFLILLVEPISRTFNDLTTPQPWFDVRLEVSDGSVTYNRIINRWLDGHWTATVQVPDGDGWRGICSGHGSYVYRPERSGVTVMTMEYFTDGCAQPNIPHRVCADYVMEDASGWVRNFGPFCSPRYDP